MAAVRGSHVSSLLSHLAARGGGAPCGSSSVCPGGAYTLFQGRRRSLVYKEGGTNTPRNNFYDHTVEKYALMEGKRTTLLEMLDFGRRFGGQQLPMQASVESANHVRSELPVRLARRLMDLQFLPHIVVTNPHVSRVYSAYLHAFTTLRTHPPVTPETNTAFTKLLKSMVDEHAPMIAALALGLKECRAKPIVGEQLQLDSFFDTMLQSRIERRVMSEHHIALQSKREGFIGVMSMGLTLQNSLQHNMKRVTEVCRSTYGISPEMVLSGDLGAEVTYIPAHLDYMCFEVLKNASRAVVEKHAGLRTIKPRHLPPIELRIMHGDKGTTIRVSDQGGGIQKPLIEKVWRYGWTTVTDNDALVPDAHAMGTSHAMATGRLHVDTNSPMAGLGFGLPLSRVYCRFLGGDLRLVSVPGYGTDIYIDIPNLDDADTLERITI